MEEDYVHSGICEVRHQHIIKSVEDLKRVTEKRLDAHAKQLDKLEHAQVQNTAILQQLTTLIEKQETQITELAKEPADKWKTVRNTILTSVVSSVCGGILGAVFSIILAVK